MSKDLSVPRLPVYAPPPVYTPPPTLLSDQQVADADLEAELAAIAAGKKIREQQPKEKAGEDLQLTSHQCEDHRQGAPPSPKAGNADAESKVCYFDSTKGALTTGVPTQRTGRITLLKDSFAIVDKDIYLPRKLMDESMRVGSVLKMSIVSHQQGRNNWKAIATVNAQLPAAAVVPAAANSTVSAHRETAGTISMSLVAVWIVKKSPSGSNKGKWNPMHLCDGPKSFKSCEGELLKDAWKRNAYVILVLNGKAPEMSEAPFSSMDQSTAELKPSEAASLVCSASPITGVAAIVFRHNPRKVKHKWIVTVYTDGPQRQLKQLLERLERFSSGHGGNDTIRTGEITQVVDAMGFLVVDDDTYVGFSLSETLAHKGKGDIITVKVIPHCQGKNSWRAIEFIESPIIQRERETPAQISDSEGAAGESGPSQDEIETILAQMTINSVRKKALSEVESHIKNAISTAIPEARLECYGSMVTGILHPGSDVSVQLHSTPCSSVALL